MMPGPPMSGQELLLECAGHNQSNGTDPDSWPMAVTADGNDFMVEACGDSGVERWHTHISLHSSTCVSECAPHKTLVRQT